MGRSLVVGIGNDLRRDDGVGRVVAERVGQVLPEVGVRLVHQLLPELALALSGCDTVVFVDAAVGEAGLLVEPVAPTPGVVRGHHADPGMILWLVETLDRRAPRAWLVRVPAADLGLGEGLSDATAALVRQAVGAVTGLLTGRAHGLA